MMRNIRLLCSTILVIVQAVIIITVYPVHGIDYPTTTWGGTCSNDALCPCDDSSVSTNATRSATSVYVAFRGFSNPLPPQSVFKRTSHRSGAGVTETQLILSGVPLKPIVIEFLPQTTNLSDSTCPSYAMSNLDALYPGTSVQHPFPTPLRSFNESVFIRNSTIRLFTDDPSSVSWSFSTNTSVAVGGVIILYNFTVWAPAGTQLYFMFNTSVGLWTLSPFLLMTTTLGTTALELQLIETGNNWISTLPCFTTPMITEGVPFRLGPDELTFALQNGGGLANTSLDGRRLVINATLQNSQSGTLTVDTGGGHYALKDGVVSAGSGELTVNWLRPTTSAGAETQPMVDLPFRFAFSVSGLETVAYSSWMLLTATSVPSYGIVFAPSSYLQGSRPLHIFLDNNNTGATVRSAAAVVGVAMRRIVLNVVSSNRWRYVDGTSSCFVVARCDGAVLSGMRAPVEGGIAVFESLTIVELIPQQTGVISPQANLYITFAVEPETIVMFQRPLFSELIFVTTTNIVQSAPSFLRLRGFSTSLRPSDSANTPLILPKIGSLSIPIAIDVVGANGLVDPAASDCFQVIMQGPLLLSSSGVTAQPSAGTALFHDIVWSSLVLTASVHYTSLSFTCTDVDGVIAPSSLLVVSPILLASNNSAVASVQFQPSGLNLISHAFEDTCAVQGVPLPPIIVEVLLTDGSLAVNVSDMVVYALVGNSDEVSIQSGVSWVKQGRAVFPNLRLYCVANYDADDSENDDSSVSSCNTRLHFEVDAAATVAPVATPTNTMILSTGLIAITRTVVPLFRLSFLPSSYVSFQRQPFVVAFGYAFPAIGLGIVKSDHSPDGSGIGLLVRASMTSGTLTGTLTATADPNGQFWFSNLIVSTASAPLEPSIRFCVEKDGNVQSGASLSQYAPVVGHCVATGVMTFVLPNAPAMLQVVSAVSPEGAPLVPISGGTADRSPLFVASTNSSFVGSPLTSSFQLIVAVLNAANLVALPTLTTQAQVELTATFASGIAATWLQLDRRPQVYPSSPFATFSNVVFAEDIDGVSGAALGSVVPPAQGISHQLTITAVNWLPWNPVHVGTMMYDLNATSAVDVSPVVRVIVNFDVTSFDRRAWVTQLAGALRCAVEQIDIIRVQESASAGDSDALLWTKTSVDVMFLLPQVSDITYTNPLTLTQRLLQWNPICAQFDLRVIHVFLRASETPPPFCDALRLQDQILIAQYCYATDETDANLCTCYTPIFTNLASQCFSTTLIAQMCTLLDRCALSSTAIVDGCAVYKSNLTVKYVLIAVYTLCGVLVVVLFLLWYQDVLGKCWRQTLGNRNRRDIEYEGLRFQRSKGEHVEVDAAVF
ncbi:membrane-associated protein, putative [Bodo saltans]|uniref:Membrane-associated protein, putative n=1 Tax=Bodo saltans TaxID=75058 RepID=A0A0S4J7I9_BODSA|nr:membrane-associated protein, putative [Bodo saltans]|eukprot:CUG87366.1 membrane-associated protein, putative [Bodo saltans]